ncbi:hypothetical protein [Plantactinospora sonchi]|uniref:ATP-binding protein n=1 Tax=Plantactinospora sonchi TaxID=1544735 RepID=A0ABU7RWR4_9ACTN
MANDLTFEDLGASASEPNGSTAARLVDCTNTAEATRWLKDEIGRGKLAGFFRRSEQIVYTPREGEAGYIALTDGEEDSDGVAQIRSIDKDRLAAEVQFTYQVTKQVRVGRGEDARWETREAMFPLQAAQTVISAPHHLPNLRPLRDVVHTPVMRRDGSVLDSPGYDPATQFLYLPTPGLSLRPIPSQPTADDLWNAVELISFMLSGFRFVTEHDRANYIGALITPFLRPLVPPPYKLVVINAHQPGSGKTYLATALRSVHGGVFRSEMPENDAELRKQITTILTCTTSPIIHIDNVTGLLRSSALAGLLSSNVWDDRTLGAMKLAMTANNRLWVITGNNVALGGDLPRRSLWSTIDPGIPNPHLRRPEEFAIPEFERWVVDQRGELIRAALVMIRSWYVTGQEVKTTTTDSYGRWVATVNAILAHAGIEGTFDSPVTDQTEGAGQEDEDWASFLRTIHEVFGERTWTGHELLDKVCVSSAGTWPSGTSADRPIPLEALPDLLSHKAEKTTNIRTLGRSLGKWLSNRAGRWAGGYRVVKRGKENKETLWQVEQYRPKPDM